MELHIIQIFICEHTVHHILLLMIFYHSGNFNVAVFISLREIVFMSHARCDHVTNVINQCLLL